MPRIGEFDPHLRPLIRLVIRGTENRELTVEARLDTGFELSLAIPDVIADSLGLEFVKLRPLTLANGEEHFFVEYRARVLWEGIERPVRVFSKRGHALVGIAMFAGYRLILDIVDGGEVIVETV